MTAPLTQLRHLLSQPVATIEGVVMQITDAQIQIATPQGLLTAQSSLPLRVGARVQVQQGTVVRVLMTDTAESWYV